MQWWEGTVARMGCVGVRIMKKWTFHDLGSSGSPDSVIWQYLLFAYIRRCGPFLDYQNKGVRPLRTTPCLLWNEELREKQNGFKGRSNKGQTEGDITAWSDDDADSLCVCLFVCLFVLVGLKIHQVLFKFSKLLNSPYQLILDICSFTFFLFIETLQV